MTSAPGEPPGSRVRSVLMPNALIRDESSAALRPGTPPAGWNAQDLTESGTLLRQKLREARARNPACQPSPASIR